MWCIMMQLSTKQKGVVAGIVSAMLISIFSIISAIIFNPFVDAVISISSVRFTIAGTIYAITNICIDSMCG